MKTFLAGILLIFIGMMIAGAIALTAAPPRGEPIILLPPPTPRALIIHVEGAVAHPGLVSLPADSRVQNAVDAAGGPLSNADLTAINLAAPLVDGTKIHIPASSQSSHAPMVTPVASIPVLNINSATVEELATLPGIGPATAQRIVDYRTDFGQFTTVDDLTQVFGIGPATLAQIKDLITVGP